jgi:Lrp/AsnC family transcriptional regulator, leucine-responsive regulatory protein
MILTVRSSTCSAKMPDEPFGASRPTLDSLVATVKRRIDRLKSTGVISGYSVRVDNSKVAAEPEAVVELRLVGNMELETILSFASQVPEVKEVPTIAGDPDALVRVRANNIQDLQRVVNLPRTNDRVTGTKTLVVLGSWSRND